MKKIFIAVICFAAVVCLTGCAGANNKIPNPMVEVKSAEDFAELGISIDAPEGATEVKYFIISEYLAHVDFMLDGNEFTYRCADAKYDDIAGVHYEFEDTELSLNVEYPDGATEVRIRTTGEGGRLASWEKDGKTFSLYTPGEMTDDEISSLCLKLCEA